MANTLSVMTNVLRNVVSKQRIRYKENGFNLDLAYICDNIIAMGYPADNIESIYRNRSEDVYKFLEENHPNHYKIYNLCSERSYNINKFHGRVAVYPFEDHNPPTIELIQKFCLDVDKWLKANSQNVAAVHCKAGKGRTGTMICCYLLFSGQQRTAEDALSCYDEKRTKDRKGVTIPSQRRYVQYFSKLIRSGVPYERRTLQLRQIRFVEANLLHSQGSVHCSVSVLHDSSSAIKVELLQSLLIDFRKTFVLDIKNVLCVAGDVKIELRHKTSRTKIFHFWFNTFFVSDVAEIEREDEETKLVYTLSKSEIDDAHKDKEHKCFSEDFKVQLVFSPVDPNSVRQASNGNTSMHQKSHSATDMPHYPLPENNSSGSDLNFIGDQKSSSSSASVNSMGYANATDSGAGSSRGSCNNAPKAMRGFLWQNAAQSPAVSFVAGEDAAAAATDQQLYNMYHMAADSVAMQQAKLAMQQQQQRQRLEGPDALQAFHQQPNNYNNVSSVAGGGGGGGGGAAGEGGEAVGGGGGTSSCGINLRQPKINYQPSANIYPNISRVGREAHHAHATTTTTTTTTTISNTTTATTTTTTNNLNIATTNTYNNNSRTSGATGHNMHPACNNNNLHMGHSTAMAAAAAVAATTNSNNSSSSKNSSSAIRNQSEAARNGACDVHDDCDVDDDDDEDDEGREEVEEDWESVETGDIKKAAATATSSPKPPHAQAQPRPPTAAAFKDKLHGIDSLWRNRIDPKDSPYYFLMPPHAAAVGEGREGRVASLKRSLNQISYLEDLHELDGSKLRPDYSMFLQQVLVKSLKQPRPRRETT